VLAVDDRDPGCGTTRTELDRYVEAELGGQDGAARFPGVALHLSVCPACRTDHDGLLALTSASPGSSTPGAATSQCGRRYGMNSGPLSVNALRNSRIALIDCVVSCGQVIDFVHAVAANWAGIFVLFSKNRTW
jgi:hypothetical protein